MKWIKRIVCNHRDSKFIRNFHGDEINRNGGYRSLWECKYCSKLIRKKRYYGDMHCKQKIVKFLGHCYDSCGWFYCGFWDIEGERCNLFPAVKKLTCRSLHICDKIYGPDYEGRP